MDIQLRIPIIDIFAGPGGLSEGFSRFADYFGHQVSFDSRLAIEKDPIAIETLQMRSFFRMFPNGEAPEDYYRVIRQEEPRTALSKFPEWESAMNHVWQAELGIIDDTLLHSNISEKIAGATNWALLGGPPCQAYSLMGRARMTGIGVSGRDDVANADLIRQKKLEKFEKDTRHVLYREYLRVVALHQPTVFVMENVKGILSAKLPSHIASGNKSVFDQIRADLCDPVAALETDEVFQRLAERYAKPKRKYHLHSFVVSDDLTNDVKNRDFLIRSEDYGIPQRRHRVIILGIREDVGVQPKQLKPAEETSVHDAIGDLPKLRSGLSKRDNGQSSAKVILHQIQALTAFDPLTEGADKLSSELNESLSRGAPFETVKQDRNKHQTDLMRWLTDERLNGVIQHQSRSHMATDLVRYQFAASYAAQNGRSPNLEMWPAPLLPNHKNVTVDVESGKTSTGGFSDRFKVQVWGEPSSTVTSHISKDGHYFIHPDPAQCRSLTVREAARLQTFPDNYFFCGNRTQQYHQVGNAVPPFLALKLAEVVADVFEKHVNGQGKVDD